MNVNLVKASMQDCNEIHSLQIRAFKELLIKYNDSSTNPGAENVQKIAERMSQAFTDYYFIQLNMINIGAVRVKKNNGCCTISPIFIVPEYQNRGYAQETILLLESLYPTTCEWHLGTIQEEEKLCHFYEKLGFIRAGSKTQIQEGMTIIGYVKRR